MYGFHFRKNSSLLIRFSLQYFDFSFINIWLFAYIFIEVSTDRKHIGWGSTIINK